MEYCKVCVKKFHVALHIASKLCQIHCLFLLVDIVLCENVRGILFGQRAHITIGNLIGNLLSLELQGSPGILILF